MWIANISIIEYIIMFINHHLPVTKNRFFYFLMILPIALAFYLSYKIYPSLDFSSTFSWTAKGYQYVLAVGKLPIVVIGILLPIAGFYGLLHKSKQLSYQAGKRDLERAREKYERYSESLNLILILLYRITNHTHALLDSLGQHTPHTDKRAKLIFDHWSSFYSEARFMPAIIEFTPHFNQIDSMMLGLEQIVCNRTTVSPNTNRNDLSDKLSALESKLIKAGEDKDNEHIEIMKSICHRYGFTFNTLDI
jgi:hypothetical protein